MTGRQRRLGCVCRAGVAAGQRQRAHPHRLRARPDAQLVGQDPGQLVEPPEHRGAVAPSEVLTHEAEVGRLVGGFDGEQLRPSAGGTQQGLVLQGQPLAVVDGPVLVLVVGEQRPAVRGHRDVDRVRVAGPEGVVGQRFEALDVDGHIRVGCERRHVLAERDHIGVGGASREVGGLVEPPRRHLGRHVGPQRVEDLLAGQAPPGGEAEELDQRRGAAAVPCRVRHRAAVDVDGELTEQPNVQPHAS